MQSGRQKNVTLKDTYNVIVSERAAQMMVSHSVFLAQASPSTAERLIDSFEAALNSLKDFSHRCPWFIGEYIPRNTYRFLLFEKRYIIIFQIKDDTVYVDYVLDCRQDYKWLL